MTPAVAERMMARRATVTGELGYSEKFLRMFEFYFAYCEAGFAHGLINDLQMTWVKTNEHLASDAPVRKSEIAHREIVPSSGRRVSALAVCLYAASAARDFAAKGLLETLADATHIFGVVFCAVYRGDARVRPVAAAGRSRPSRGRNKEKRFEKKNRRGCAAASRVAASPSG